MIKPKSIKAAREKMGYSQQKFAKGLGVNQATICRWETGQRKMSGPARILMERLLAELNQESAE